ncbi:MAG TPA: hypothetical protein VIW71_14145 [Streptomyces sp.]
MALALLTVLIRHRDGWEITLSEVGAKYGYGRDAMANAMGLLQVARYVVKVRMMSVEGNEWSTEMYVFDTPASDAEVSALLAEVELSPDVRRASVIEPTAAAVAHAERRRGKLQPKRRQGPSVAVPRVPENPYSGATCGNDASSQVGPECGDSRLSGEPAVFKKTVREKTREKTDAPSARSAALDAGGQSSGSRGRAGGGSAAAEKSRPARSKGDAAAIRTVRDELERRLPDLARALPPATPRTLGDAILAGLAAGTPAERTPEQLVRFRVLNRWDKHWAQEFYAGRLPTQPVGPLVSMLAADRSDHDRCDERVDVDSGQPCRACGERQADRRVERSQAAGAAVSVPAAASPTLPGPRAVVYDTAGMAPECWGRDGMCGRPTLGAESGLCRRCEHEAAETGTLASSASGGA